VIRISRDAKLDLVDLGWLPFEQSGSSISTPYLIVLVFWLTIIKLLPVATLLVCATPSAAANASFRYSYPKRPR